MSGTRISSFSVKSSFLGMTENEISKNRCLNICNLHEFVCVCVCVCACVWIGGVHGRVTFRTYI